jgi:Tfp pilus assembly protein PilZ
MQEVHGMKKHTSKLYRAIALVYAAFPFSFTTLSMILFDIPISSLLSLLIGFGFWFLSGLSGVVAFGLIEITRWSWHCFLGLNAMISYYAARVALDSGTTQYPFLSLLLFLSIQGFLIYRIGRELRVPYFLPRIRWWESNPLLKTSFPAEILTKSMESYSAEILDISHAGCFVRTNHEFSIDETITIKASFFGNELDLKGQVVWKAKESVTHPRGIGIRFIVEDKKTKKLLFAISHRHKEILKLFSRSRYLMSQEDFITRLNQLKNTPILAEKKQKDK